VTHVDGSARILAAGLVKGQPFGVYAGEWRLAIRDVLAELQREADTAEHERPAFDPSVGRMPGVYNVETDGGSIQCRDPRDLNRCLGWTTGQHKPARVSTVLPDPVPEHIDDAQTQPYPAPGNA
jgi:hypothetical protein